MHKTKPILVLATRNKGKIAEIESLLKGVQIQVRSLDDYPDIGEIEEDGRTFAENAVKKAATVSLSTGELAIADDSGLEVDALDGRPGVHSARYAPTSKERNEGLLEELADIEPERRGARFVCVAALADPQGHAVVREGTCPGQIAMQPSGEGGFGYDPVFYLPDRDATMAEISRDEKNAISHRGNAFRAIVEVLKSVIDEHGGKIPLPQSGPSTPE